MTEPLRDWSAFPLDRARQAGYDTGRLTGVHIYGCIEAFGTDRQGAMRKSAHAHVAAADPYQGTICFKGGTKRMTRRLVAHELAHVLTRSGHTAKWAACVTALGQPAEAKRCRARVRPRGITVWYWHDASGVQRHGTHAEMVAAAS